MQLMTNVKSRSAINFTHLLVLIANRCHKLGKKNIFCDPRTPYQHPSPAPYPPPAPKLSCK